MGYLDRGRADRLDPAPPAAGMSLGRRRRDELQPGLRPSDLDDRRSVSRYARGRDYHDVIRPRLVELAEFIGAAAGGNVASRAAVDSSAVLERDLAARAGLGWVGKNTNLLAPGARLLLLHRHRAHDRRAAASISARPTAAAPARPVSTPVRRGAFVAPYVLDARRCISYLTIEHRGDIAGELADQIGEWLFGCDVCQDVCPWNRKAEPGHEPALGPSGSFGTLEALLELDPEAFRRRFRWLGDHADEAGRASPKRGDRAGEPRRAARRRGAHPGARRRGRGGASRRRVGAREARHRA